jgi:hypothetical protein
MRGAYGLITLGGYIAALLAVLLVWGRSRRVSYEFSWRGRFRAFFFTISAGQLRLHRHWRLEPTDDAMLGFELKTWPFAPAFSNQRSPVDAVHYTWDGFLYACGENPHTHTRYRVLSVPIWFPLVIAAMILASLHSWR